MASPIPQSTRRLSLAALTLAGLCALVPQFAVAAPAHHNKKAAKSAAPLMNSVKDLKRYIACLKKAAALRKKKNEKDADKETKIGAALDQKQEDDEAAGTDYLEAYLYYLRQRAYPKNFIDPKALSRAIAQRNRMRPAQIGAANGVVEPLITTGNWQFVGPKNLGIPYKQYYGNGPLSGRVNAFVFDPTAVGTYYLASMGGVWKTTDSGVTWTPLSDAFPDLKTSSLAIDPTNHNTIYVGTGDYDGSLGYPFGIMKTTDGGATFTNYGKADFGNASVSAIVVDPETPSIITLTTGRGIYSNFHYVWRSADSGVTWTKVINTDTDWSDLKIGAKDANGLRYYYAVGNGGNIWRSADRGATWTQLSNAMFTGTPSEMKIAPSVLDSKTVYLMDTANKMFYKSADAGATWTNITAGFPADSSKPGDFYNWSQFDYDKALICSSQTLGGSTTDVLYASLIDMDQYYYDTPSAAYKWRSIGQTYTGNAVLHNDQHALVVNPNDPNTLLVGCDGGAYRFTYTPSATDAGTWNYVSLNAALGLTQFYKAAWHPTDATRMIGGAQDNASPTATGDLTNYKNFGGGDGGFSAINPATPNTQYTTSQNLGAVETTDNWMTNNDITPPFGTEKPAFIAPIFLDQKTPQYLYAWHELPVSPR